MLRYVLAAVAATSLMLGPAPAAGQFRELLELLQPKPTPKVRHRHTRAAPPPPTKPAQEPDKPAKPPAATDDEAASAAPVPLPPMDPRQTGEAPAKPPAEPGRQTANAAVGTGEDLVEDRWSEAEIMDALRQCIERLGPIVAEVKPIAPIKAGRCGTAAPVKLLRLGTDPPVEISPAATLDCDMVLALDKWMETAVQPAAERLLGFKVVRIRNVTSYACRNRNSAATGPLSEHAFANALDIAGFFTEDGRFLGPNKDWGLTEREIEAARRAAEAARRAAAEAAKMTAEKNAETNGAKSPPQAATDAADDEKDLFPTEPVPLPPLRPEARLVGATRSDATAVSVPKSEPTPERAFLRQVHKDACGIFGTVLGPEANDLHKDHFHVDLAARRHGAFCE